MRLRYDPGHVVAPSCRRWESNPPALLGHGPLKPACLPNPPRRHSYSLPKSSLSAPSGNRTHTSSLHGRRATVTLQETIRSARLPSWGRAICTGEYSPVWTGGLEPPRRPFLRRPAFAVSPCPRCSSGWQPIVLDPRPLQAVGGLPSRGSPRSGRGSPLLLFLVLQHTSSVAPSHEVVKARGDELVPSRYSGWESNPQNDGF